MLCSVTTGNSELPVYTAGLHPNLHNPSVATALLFQCELRLKRAILESASDRHSEVWSAATCQVSLSVCPLSFAKIWLTCHLSIAITSQTVLCRVSLSFIVDHFTLIMTSAITDHSVLAPDSWQASLHHQVKLLYQECCHMFPCHGSLNFRILFQVHVSMHFTGVHNCEGALGFKDRKPGFAKWCWRSEDRDC